MGIIAQALAKQGNKKVECFCVISMNVSVDEQCSLKGRRDGARRERRRKEREREREAKEGVARTFSHAVGLTARGCTMLKVLEAKGVKCVSSIMRWGCGRQQ